MAIVNNVRNADGSTPARLPQPTCQWRTRRWARLTFRWHWSMLAREWAQALDHIARVACLLPTRIYWRTPLEILGVESWVAAKGLKIRTDDQFIRWRHFVSKDESAVEAMELAERELGVENALSKAMKAGDQYGTGVVIMMSNEAMLDEPLDAEPSAGG